MPLCSISKADGSAGDFARWLAKSIHPVDEPVFSRACELAERMLVAPLLFVPSILMVHQLLPFLLAAFFQSIRNIVGP